jgi:exonuclease VII small subunit
MAPLIQELEGVAEQLENGGLKGEKRLALLRRQAQLGDLRDAILLRARRGLQ